MSGRRREREREIKMKTWFSPWDLNKNHYECENLNKIGKEKPLIKLRKIKKKKVKQKNKLGKNFKI